MKNTTNFTEEKTIELAIHPLIPGLKDDNDQRLSRLETTLRNRRGIRRAHLEREKSPIDLCLHYDPGMISQEEVQELARKAASRIAVRYRSKRVEIEGMDCSDCAIVIEHGLSRMQGVLGARVDYAGQNLSVEYDTHRTSQRAIERRVRQLGYEVRREGPLAWLAKERELVFSGMSGFMLLLGFFLPRLLPLPFWSAYPFYSLAYILGGYDVSRHALHTLRERHFDTDLLMILAALGAAILGDFAEGALLLFLFSLGHALEDRALRRAQRAISALAELAPKTALVRREGQDHAEPVEQVRLGETVIVLPGVRVPVDGQVTGGYSAVDQSPITGESVPVEKNPGDKVFAGSVNNQGVLEVQVTRLAKDSTLARVMQMVEEAQAQKSQTQQVTEKFTRVFVPAVLITALLLIVIPLFFGAPFAQSFLRAMTLLVAASPCALALGTPAAILTGVAQAARNGVLIKGGAHLENLGRMQAIAFDKTGTLTHGQPVVTDIVSLAGDKSQVLTLAAAVEARSAHPLAKAILQAASDVQLEIPPAKDVESVTGRGVQAWVDKHAVRVGSLSWIDGSEIEVSPNLRQAVLEMEEQGKSVLLVVQDDQLVGLIAVSDTIRPDAAQALSALSRIGVRNSIMLSGDNRRAAAYIAGQIGMREFRAELLPEEKVQAIRQLVEEYPVVGMVGDGVNDAPALANATVGIAMGGASTDAALESADVALMAADLRKLPFAVGLGRAARRIILQNLVIALGVIVILSALAITGLAGIGLAVVIHEGSTLLVVFNALRLLGFSLH